MNYERQTVDAVASVLRWIGEPVSSVGVERVVRQDRSTARTEMLPYIRRIHIGDMNRRVMEMTRVDIQTQCDDTVAPVDGGQGIVV